MIEEVYEGVQNYQKAANVIYAQSIMFNCILYNMSKSCVPVCKFYVRNTILTIFTKFCILQLSGMTRPLG